MPKDSNSSPNATSDVYVTRSFLPDLADYVHYLEGIWERNQLTNNGPLVRELETRLKDYLDVDFLSLVCNGTVALQIAIEAMELREEVITTPFSYVATTSSLVWQHCRPVFADIDPDTLSIDPAAIEAAITPRTTGILATHVYGFPCDVEAIRRIADKHSLRVIYDAAHCFGVRWQGRGLMREGDVAISSFHATKVFHCAEGGAVATADPELARRVAYMRNFGHRGQEDFQGIGINGKMSELHAAMGLCVLPRIEKIISARKKVIDRYLDGLGEMPGVRCLRPLPEVDWNGAYFPVIFPDEESLLKVRGALADAAIHPRRYFFPPLSGLSEVVPQVEMPVAQEMSARVLCLPVFPGLPESVIDRVLEEVRRWD